MGEWIPDPNFPDRIDLRQYRVNSEVTAEVQHTREDSQNIVSHTHVSHAEALTLTEEGADFADASAPSIHDVVGGEGAPMGNGAEAESKGKGKKGRGKGKGKKGDAANAGPNQEPEPDKPPTPLEKAKALKKVVFLDKPALSFIGSTFQ